MARVRFGLVWNGTGSPVEVARRAEDIGYATLLFPDHTEMVAPIPAMAAAAAVTGVLRLGTQVINPVFRPLGALAQELAAVDLISEGRLEIGVGAGYAESEVTSLGLEFPGAPAALRRPFVQLGRSSDEVADRIAALAESHGVSYITIFDGRSTGFDRVVRRLANR